MGYKALARKWRPKNFDEVVGQHEAVSVLINALSFQRVHHAYLFTGTRGVGKTTMARIFAKALNCDKGVTSTPCGECYSCVGIDNNNMVDLIEVDAASRTKVEETRELLDNVQYTPTQGRFKIYLIDEIHMFSKHSFNALLKTLEEPPEHVKFLLATTDYEKIPATVLSRCLKLNLKKISQKFLHQYIEKVLKGEKIKFSKSAIDIIAKSADGSARDALSLLDRIIVLSEGDIITEDVSKLLGIVDNNIINEILELLIKKEKANLFRLSRNLADLVPNYELVIDQMLSTLKDIAVLQAIGESNKLSENDEKLLMLAKTIKPEICQLFFEICLLTKRNLIHSVEPIIAFEIMLVRLLSFMPVTEGYSDSISLPADKAVTHSQITADKKVEEVVLTTKKNKLKEGDPTHQKLIDSLTWSEIVESIKLSGLPGELVNNSEMVKLKNNTISLKISANFQHLNQQAYINAIEKKLIDTYSRPLKVIVSVEESTASLDSPANQKRIEQEQQKAREKERLLGRSPIRDLQEVFDAKLSGLELKDE